MIARHGDDHIGPQAAIIALNTHFGLKIGMFGKATSLQHVAQLLFAPAPPRLRRITQRITKLGRFTAHGFVRNPHRFHQPLQIAIGFAPLILDLANRLFVSQQAIINGLQQRFERRARGFFGLAKALIGLLQKLALRLTQQLTTHFAELRRQAVARLAQLCDPLLKGLFTRFTFSGHGHLFQPRFIALNRCDIKLHRCLTRQFLMHIAFGAQCACPAPAKQPAERQPRQ